MDDAAIGIYLGIAGIITTVLGLVVSFFAWMFPEFRYWLLPRIGLESFLPSKKNEKASPKRKGVKSGDGRPVMLRVLLAAAVVFTIAFLITAMVQSVRKAHNVTPQDKAHNSTTQNIEEDSVTMAQFFRELDQEGAAPYLTLKRCIGKRVTWEGYFRAPLGEATFMMTLTQADTYPDVSCYFPDDAKEELLTLQKGCKVRVSGILESRDRLKNCKILTMEKTDKQTTGKAEEASVTMAQFFRELDQEGAAPYLTLKRYIGKRVTWEGYFERPSGASSFALSLSPDTLSPDVSCYFPEDAKEELLTLRKGCKVRVSGILESKDRLENCKVLAIEEVPPKAKEPKVK